LSRVDSKITTLETLQPAVDRKLAELAGNYKGVSEELQSQIRRIDRMDTQLWEWRHQLEEEMRGKFAETEQNFQRVSSTVRVAKNESVDSFRVANQRLQQVEQQLFCQEDIVNLDQRLANIEDERDQEIVVVDRDLSITQTTPVIDDSASRAKLADLEARLADVLQKIHSVATESQDCFTKVEVQEERLKSMRTMLEGEEGKLRQLTERVDQSDWDGRLQVVERRAQELDQYRIEQGEAVEILQKQVARNEQSQENMNDHLQRLIELEGSVANISVSESYSTAQEIVNNLMVSTSGETPMQEQWNEWKHMVEAEMQALRADQELAPRVSSLVTQLKDVAPKVIGQEKCVRDVMEKVSRLECEWKTGKIDSFDRRISQLEREAGRIQPFVKNLTYEVDIDNDTMIDKIQTNQIQETE